VRSYAELIHRPTFMHAGCSLPFTAVHPNTRDDTLPSGYIILSPARFGSFRTILKSIKYERIYVGSKGEGKVPSRTGHEGPEVE
jgi:hypothetical protein